MRRFLQLRLPSVGQVLAGLSIFGCGFLLFVSGSCVMHFDLPPAEYFRTAFIAAQAWHEREQARNEVSPSGPAPAFKKGGATIDKADKTYDGYTLYTTSHGSEATLINMVGNVVHRWAKPFSLAWPKAPHVPRPFPDTKINWFHCHLFANGDLLAVYQVAGDTPYGYGLVKLDKDSKVLWCYSAFVHHEVAVGEDGRIYALTHRYVRQVPAGLEFMPTPYLADYLVVLSPEGKELETIPILDAFQNSSYALTLASILKDGKGDCFHTNSVKVLSRALAAIFPLFKAGQVLISLRNLNTLAVLDIQKRSVVWAAQGLWRLQHDPEFLDNGHLLLFDNLGSPRGCRILEYDPVNQSYPWSYASENATPFHAVFRGMKQRLPNGNTLIVDTDGLRLLEVAAQKELVWEHYCQILDWGTKPIQEVIAINGARRYGPDELTFLKGGLRARP